MFLNIFNNLNNNSKKDENIQDFLDDIKEEIDKPKEYNNDNISILDKILSENKVSIATKNKMNAKLDEILIKYANETIEKGDLYYIVEKNNDEFVVYKYGENDDNVLKIKEEELPENAFVNSALRFIDNNYTIDEKATSELETRITNMANELISEQNEILESYRKEGHLYRVSENINDSIFLHDITDKPSFEVEEVDFPEELLEKAVEGVIFKYIDGKYILEGEKE